MLPRRRFSLMERIETTILKNLIHNEEYSRKVIPFIEPTYFEQRTEKVIFEEITQFIVKYGSSITTEALNIEVENRTDLNESEIKETRDICNSFTDSPVDHQWLLDTTEKRNRLSIGQFIIPKILISASDLLIGQTSSVRPFMMVVLKKSSAPVAWFTL